MTTNVFFAKHVLFFLLYTFTIQEVLVLEICQHWQLYLRLDILICTCCLTQMNSLCATVITFLLWFGLGETWSPSSTASFPASWLFFGGIQSGSWKLHAFNVFMFCFFSVHFHTLYPYTHPPPNSSSSPPLSIIVTVVLVIRDFYGNHTKPAFLQFW